MVAGVAVDLLAGPSSAAGPLGDRVGQAPHVPLVGLTGGDAEHAVAFAADQDRQRRLQRLGLGDRVGGPECRRANVVRPRASSEPHLAHLGEAVDPLASGGRSMPYRGCSFSCQPAPMPSRSRPPESGRPWPPTWPPRPGWRYVSPAPATRAVPARWPSPGPPAAAVASSVGGTRGRSAVPSPMKWSATQTPSQPVASAWRRPRRCRTTAGWGWARSRSASLRAVDAEPLRG